MKHKIVALQPKDEYYSETGRESRIVLGSFPLSWEQRKLGEMYDRVSEKNDLSYTKEQIISVANMYFKPDSYITDEEYLRTYNVFLLGDIAFEGNKSKNYAHGRFVENTIGNGIVSHVFDVFRPKIGFDLLYWKYAINNERIMGDLLVRCTKASTMMTNLVAADFLKESLLVPSVEEQKKIGQYLTQLDNLITLHQRKGVYCCIFTFGSQTQRKEKKTFTWEQRKLGEISDKVTEKNTGLQYMETFTNSAEFGVISQRDFFDHAISKIDSLDGYYIVRNEDFVYNPRISVTAPVGPINRNKLGRNGVMSPLYTVFRPREVDNTYLEHFFKSRYWHDYMYFNGDSGARSDRFSIKDDLFFLMPIPLPHIAEQEKIGDYLTTLDNLITLHQRKD